MHPGRKKYLDVRRGPVVIAAVLLVGFALRAYAISAQALRGDEGFSVQFSALPLREMLRVLKNFDHPPLFYFFLKGWMALAGNSELAVRWPAVLGGPPDGWHWEWLYSIPFLSGMRRMQVYIPC